MENNYFQMVKPPTEQSVTADEFKQYYSNTPCLDAPHVQYVINSEDQQFLRPQIILAQDTNIVNSESSQVIVDQARYNAEGVQRTAHVQNFIERNSDNFHAVRQIQYTNQEENIERIVLHQQNQQQQRVQHHIVQQHIATSEQHTNHHVMQGIVFPHQALLVQRGTQQILTQQQSQEHINNTQQRQPIRVYQPDPQPTRIIYEQPSTVAYKPVPINVPQAVTVEFNHNANEVQNQPDHVVEHISQQEMRDSQTSPLHSARLMDSSVQFVQHHSLTQQTTHQQPRMIMASPGLISMPGQVLTQQRAPHGCQAQQNHNMQNKLRPTTPSNNNCVRLRNITPPSQTYFKQIRAPQATVKKQVVSPAKNESHQLVIQVKQSRNTPENQLNDLDLEDSITAAVVQKVPGNSQQVINRQLNNADTASTNVNTPNSCQQRPEARMPKNCSRPKTTKKSTHQNAYTSFHDLAKQDQETQDNNIQQQQQQLAQQQNEPRRDTARMLVILQSREQRLITFTLPKETCAVQDLLDQVGIPYSPNTDIQCVMNPGTDIDYIVTVGNVEVPHHSQPEINSPEKVPEICKSPEPPKEDPPKYIEGMLALCKFCGYTGVDFSKCQRCKRKFAEEPKSIPQTPLNKKDNKDSILSRKIPYKDNLSSRFPKDNLRRAKKTRRDPEPEVLTLSSDEEGSKPDQVENNSLDYEGPSQVHLKEPVMTPDMEKDMKVPVRRDSVDICGGVTFTVVECRLMRIGSYKCTPIEKVVFNSKGIRIAAFTVFDNSKKEILNIQHREILKVLIHFGRTPIIFIYLLPSCALYIRNKLNMGDPKDGIYFDSCAAEEIYKRIILIPSSFPDDFQKTIYQLYGKPNNILDELTRREVDEILTKIKLRDRPIDYGPLANEIRQILIYPPGKGGIPINTEDYGSLAQDQFLNDVIIDFYLKYLCKEILSEEMRNKTHVFSSFFYKRLTTKVEKPNSRMENIDLKLTSAQKRHNRVKNWTKNVNIFEKDFIVIPINESSHWFLAIICFPGLKGPHTMMGNKPVEEKNNINKKNKKTIKVTEESPCGPAVNISNKSVSNPNKNLFGDEERDEADGTDSELEHSQSDSESDQASESSTKSECIKQPCILIFDSLAGGVSRRRVVATLRDYLTCEYQSRTGTSDCFTRYNVRGCCPKVPQQNNFTDCGLYLLQYVEQFFKVPITNYTIPIKELANWFEEIVVTRKREEISNLIKKLVSDFNPDSLPLPDISFPTLNGKLIEVDMHEGVDDYDEHFAEIEEMEEDEELYEDEEALSSEYGVQEEESEISLNESVMCESQARGLKRAVTKDNNDCESAPVRRRFKIHEEDKKLFNGREKFRYS